MRHMFKHFMHSGFSGMTGAGGTIPVDTTQVLALGHAKVGKVYTLVGFSASQNFKDKICAMGLNSGARIKIISNSGHGPVGLEVRQTRLGIGRGMAMKIKVREVEP